MLAFQTSLKHAPNSSMDAKILQLLKKMNEGNPMLQSELMRLIVHDLIIPRNPQSDVGARKIHYNPRADFEITFKGNEVLRVFTVQ
jgi:hypothetical protein